MLAGYFWALLRSSEHCGRLFILPLRFGASLFSAMNLLTAAQLGILTDSGNAILTLTEGLDEGAFFATRLTREEVRRHLMVLAQTVANIPPEVRVCLPEVNWEGWTTLGWELQSSRRDDKGSVWFGVRSLVPATLLWLRLYRQRQPELFAFFAPAGPQPDESHNEPQH